MRKGYYSKQIIIKKHWYGNETKSQYIPVKILGEKPFNYPQVAPSYLIELPNGKKIITYEHELFFES